MYSRILLSILVGVMALGTASRSQAQFATPSAAALYAGLGLPEITLTATDEGLELSQSEVPAGRYLVTLDNQSSDPDLVAQIARLVVDVDTASTLCRDLLPPDCLALLYPNVLPGGVSGRMPQAVIELQSGEYGLWGWWTGDYGGFIDEPVAILTVTGDPEAAITGPVLEAPTIVVTKGDDGYGFAIHVEGELRPGPHLVQFVNAADQPLYIAAAQDPAPDIVDAVAGTPVFHASRGPSPPFEARDDTQFGRVTSTHPQSPNTKQWVVMDLTRGDVYLACYIPDPTSREDYINLSWYAATALIVPVTE